MQRSSKVIGHNLVRLFMIFQLTIHGCNGYDRIVENGEVCKPQMYTSCSLESDSENVAVLSFCITKMVGLRVLEKFYMFSRLDTIPAYGRQRYNRCLCHTICRATYSNSHQEKSKIKFTTPYTNL